MSEQPNTPKASPRRSLRRLLVNIGIFVVVFGLVQWWQARPLASGPAPELTGLGVDGRPHRLGNLRGQTVLVHFWATWCPVCNATDGAIQSIAEDYPVISIAMQSGSPTDILEHMAEQGLSFPAISDPRGEIAGLWGVTGVPTSFIIDPRGRIAHTSIGFSTEAGLRARLWAAGEFQ
jgi:peroxiredoxin